MVPGGGGGSCGCVSSAVFYNWSISSDAYFMGNVHMPHLVPIHLLIDFKWLYGTLLPGKGELFYIYIYIYIYIAYTR